PFSRAIRAAQHEERRQKQRLERQQQTRATKNRAVENQDRSEQIRGAFSEAHRHFDDIRVQKGIQLLPQRQVIQVARPEKDENHQGEDDNAVAEAHRHLPTLQAQEEQFILQIELDPSDLLDDQEVNSD
ncbi:Uncharacterized protein APZ42_005732, partial [Daphnia magna]